MRCCSVICPGGFLCPVGSDLRTALLAGRFYWQVLMPTSTPGMSPECCFSCLCNVVVVQEMSNVFFSKLWEAVCLWFFFWGREGCFGFYTCSLCFTALQPTVFEVFYVPCTALELFCWWYIRLTLQTFHMWKLETPSFLIVTVSAIPVCHTLNSFIWSSLFHVP